MSKSPKELYAKFLAQTERNNESDLRAIEKEQQQILEQQAELSSLQNQIDALMDRVKVTKARRKASYEAIVKWRESIDTRNAEVAQKLKELLDNLQ